VTPPTGDDAAVAKQHERSAESTRRLIAAALALIAEKGFEKTSAIEIGVSAGYSREMVRSRWGSKEQLLESIMENEYKSRLLKPPPSDLTGLDAALYPLDVMIDMATENPNLLRAFFVLCFESVGPIPSLAPWMRDWFAAYRAEVTRALKAGQKDGSVAPEVDPSLEARDVIIHGAGLGFIWALDPDATSFVTELKRWRARLRIAWSRES
jgi:AcrR family transcriptional regulator